MRWRKGAPVDGPGGWPNAPPVRWIAGLAASVLVHLCGVLILTRIAVAPPPLEPAMMLELAPMTQVPETPPMPDPAEPAPPQPAVAPEQPPDPKVAPREAPQSEPPSQDPVKQEQPAATPPPPPAAETVSPEPPPPLPEPVAESPPELVVPDPPLPEPPVPVPSVPMPHAAAPPPRPIMRPVAKPSVTPRPTRPVETPEAAAPAPAAPAPPVAQASAQAVADWRARLLAHLNRFKRYPAAALMRRVQGVAYVHLLLMPDGTARDVRLQTSSGAVVLDEEALALVGRATPMPARPDSGPTELVVPVQFAVR